MKDLLSQNDTMEGMTGIKIDVSSFPNAGSFTDNGIKAIRELMEHTAGFVQKHLPKIYTWELVELLFKQPYCRIGNLVNADIAKRQTASVYLKQLCDLGILKEIKSGRENIFVHPKYIELLTGEENVWVFYTDVKSEAEVEAVEEISELH